MKKVFKFLIAGGGIVALSVPIVMLANYLYGKGKLPDHESCETYFGFFWRFPKDHCDIIDGRVAFYLIAACIILTGIIIVMQLKQKNN